MFGRTAAHFKNAFMTLKSRVKTRMDEHFNGLISRGMMVGGEVGSNSFCLYYQLVLVWWQL
jgi:hypothetical protein